MLHDTQTEEQKREITCRKRIHILMSGTTAEMRRVGRTDSPEVVRVREESPESSFRELDDVFLQTQARIWLGEVLHIRLDEETAISDLLSDGELLFQVSKVIWKVFLKKNVGQKSSNIFIHERTSFAKTDGRYMAYPKVDSFLKICQILGLTGIDLCSPSDVVEKRDVRRVCMCIRSLSKKARLRNLKVPDFDIVTYTIAMPTNLVGGIRRYLEQSRQTQSSSKGYFTSKKKTSSKHQESFHTLLTEFDEAEIFNEREFECHFTGAASVSNDLFSLDGDSLEEISDDEGILSELHEDFLTGNNEGENVHKGIYSAEMDQILWPLSSSASAKHVQNHHVDCKQTCGSSEKTSPKDFMESFRSPSNHLPTCLLPDCHESSGGMKEGIMKVNIGDKSNPMFNNQGETDVQIECMNQQEFQEDCSADHLESHFGECSEKVLLLIRKIEDAFEEECNKSETGAKSVGIIMDTSPRNSLHQSPSVEDSIGHLTGTSDCNNDKIDNGNVRFSVSEVPGSIIRLCTDDRDSQTGINNGYEHENTEHPINAEISSNNRLDATLFMATKLISDDQYNKENEHMFLLPEKHTCKALEKFKVPQNRSPNQYLFYSDLRNTDFFAQESCNSDKGNESISRSFCFTSEIDELHQNTISKDVLSMKTSSIVEDLQQASTELVSSMILENRSTGMPYSTIDSINIELFQSEQSHDQRSTIILDGSYCDKSSDTLPCYTCSDPNEENIKPNDIMYDKKDHFRPILEKVKDVQLQDSQVHRAVTDSGLAQGSETSCSLETPMMCKSSSIMKGDESDSEPMINDCNAEIQMKMIEEFVKTLNKKQYSDNVLDGCYCDKSSDTSPYYTCSTPSEETIKPADNITDEKDFASPILERVKNEQLQDSPVHSDLNDPASVLESEATCNWETPTMCKSSSEYCNVEIQVRIIGGFVETLHKKKYAAKILDGCYCNKFPDTSSNFACSTSSEETIKPTDTISSKEDFSSSISERVKNEQLQASPMHSDAINPALVQESEESCNQETPMMFKSTYTMKGDESRSELAIEDCNAKIQMKMIDKFVETLHEKQHAANILTGCYCDKSSDTSPYYTCSTPSEETIKAADTISEKEDFPGPILERVKNELLQDSPAHSDLTDPAMILESEASWNLETSTLCKSSSKVCNAEIQVKILGEFVETLHNKQHAAKLLDACYCDKFSDTSSYFACSTSSEETIKSADTISGKEDFSRPILERIEKQQLQDSPMHSNAINPASVQECEASCNPETPKTCESTSIMKGDESGNELVINDCNTEIQMRMIGEFVPIEQHKGSMFNQDMDDENVTEPFTESSSAAMAEVYTEYGNPLCSPEASEVCIDQVEVLSTPSRSCAQQTSLKETNCQQFCVSIAADSSPTSNIDHAFQLQMQAHDFSFSDDTYMFDNDVIKNVVYVENLNVDCIDIPEFPGLQTEETKRAEQHPCLEDHHILKYSTMNHSHANIPNPGVICDLASLSEDRKQNHHAQQHSILGEREEEETIVSADQNSELKNQILLEDHANSMDQETGDHTLQSNKDKKESSNKQAASSDSIVKENTQKPVRKVIKTVAGSITLIGALLFLHHFRKKKSGKSSGQIPVLLQTPKPQKRGVFQRHKVETSNSDVVYYPVERLKL